MKRTNKATTTTMVRRASAALLAVCITALHLVMPVKAATAFTTKYASGYYPDTNPLNPTKYYFCELGGTNESAYADMNDGSSTQPIRILSYYLYTNDPGSPVVAVLRDETAYSHVSTSYALSGLNSYSLGYRITGVLADYYVKTHVVASLDLN